MLRDHLRDAAAAAAKAWSHPEVQPRHIGYAIARHFRDRPEAVALLPRAKAALEPRGVAHNVPELNEDAVRLLESLGSPEAAIEALKELLEAGDAGDPPPPPAEERTATAASRGPGEDTTQPPPTTPEAVDDVLAELDALVGLETVKEQVRSVIAVVRANQERAKAGLSTVNPGLHLVFTGAPGTGKTTVARLIARLYAASGALPGQGFTEADRSRLVAAHVGQTAIKTSQVVERTVPGVLFVDEAYALTPTHASDFGAEAIATLVKAMEDHRHELAVIVAGYRDEMADFVESNPGLRSRLKTFIDFPDYEPDELVRIFERIAESTGLHLSERATDKAEQLFEEAVDRTDFGNARFARTLFEQAYSRMALRAAEDSEVHVDELKEILPEDLEWTEVGPNVQKRRIGFDDFTRELPRDDET